ncbi:metallophosphoesteras-like protein [Pseudovirgaria hyperparasitica]|uniref:Metallophosphoesteras-like protein n=1 Tax=Pseudovirgaria hyperparasitica TaxID=470096 RepID=A0A6A6WM53_9PEZI|nr:metallophosphoesteras-like protein [Pseudovirgaria hyperparasitica]KAF2763099.1 metallophosphoesteras-like protein [Pseudovirgaria hyperparasitica]
MKLYALGDIHLSYKANIEALQELEPHPEDAMILCGDVGESAEHLEIAFKAATQNFKLVFWVPGNHELYSLPSSSKLRGEAKYKECVWIARKYGILTPEDDFYRWDGEGGPAIICPIFTLYDYSFRPAHISRENAVKWAEEADTVATDEFLLHPDPHPTRDAWCEALVAKFEDKLEEAAAEGVPLIIINHWPLRQDLVYIPRAPRFIIWCGTTKTENWHTRFNAKVVVSGHLHVPRTDWKSGVRFEECSLGYPRQWEQVKASGKDVNDLIREILPGPPVPEYDSAEPQWRRWG